MNEIVKVVIQVENACDGEKKVCYGEIEENKLKKLENIENFGVGDENYILMENDEKIN